jgi:ABC-type transport system involved in multi-copper enzyme maturation permease subunit
MSNFAIKVASAGKHGRRLTRSLRWRQIAAALITGVVVLTAWRHSARWVIMVPLLMIQLIVTTSAVWPFGRIRPVGPLFWYDLTRLARRSRITRVRAIYGLSLLALLYFLFRQRFPQHIGLAELFGASPALPLGDWPRLAFSFLLGLMAIQGAVAFVITPAYLAGAIAEEKETRTLEFYFTTRLEAHEIVLGKFFGRLTHLAGILMTGLPILCLTLLWGGVDVRFVLAGLALTALILLSVGAISILCSVLAPTVLTAVVSSYGAVAILVLLSFLIPSCSPWSFLGEFDKRFTAEMDDWRGQLSSILPVSGPPFAPGTGPVLPPPPDSTTILLTMLIEPVSLYGSIFLVCTALAVGLVRKVPQRSERAAPLVEWPPPDEKESPEPFADSEVFIGQEPLSIPLPTPPVDDLALLWKEVYHGTTSTPSVNPLKWLADRWLRILVWMSLVGGLFFGLHLAAPVVMSTLIDMVNPPLRVFSIALMGSWCIALAFRAGTIFCRERDQLTLESLLLLPLEREEILRAKWLGCISRWKEFGYALTALWLLGLLTGALHPLAVLLLAAACFAYVALLVSLGLWLSLVSPRTLWANLSVALILLVTFAGAELATRFDLVRPARAGGADWLRHLVEVGLNPIRTWWFVGFSWSDLARAKHRGDSLNWASFQGVLVGLALVGATAWLLWRLARVWLGRETGRR